MSQRRKHESQRQKNLLFQKVAVFIDAENIELSGLKHHEGRTDYKKILENVGDREVVRILYYKPDYKEISPTFSDLASCYLSFLHSSFRMWVVHPYIFRFLGFTWW